jgi:hypothetical protein
MKKDYYKTLENKTYWCVTFNGYLLPLNMGMTRKEAKWTIEETSMEPWSKLKKEGYGLQKVRVEIAE